MKQLRKILGFSKLWRNNYLILREFKYFKGTVVLTITFTILAAIFEGFSVGFLMSFLQSLVQPDAAGVETGINWIDELFLGANQPAEERIYRVSAFILLTTLMRSGFFYLSRVFGCRAQTELTHRLKVKVSEQVQNLSQKFFTKARSGALVNTMTTEITQLRQAVDVISTVFGKVAILMAYIVSMLLLSWKLTTVAIMLFALSAVAMSTLLKKVRERSFEFTKSNSQYTSVALESLNGIKTIQAFVAERFEQRRVKLASRKVKATERKLIILSSLIAPTSEVVSTTILLGMLIYAFTFLIPSGQLTVASLLTFLFILFRMIPLLKMISNGFSKLNTFQGSISNIQNFLKTEDKPYISSGTKRLNGFKSEIELKSVSFGYELDNLVLKDIDLVLKKGTMTALVGGSGAGKTTLADLIPRFYDPQKGIIAVDGVDQRNFDLKSLRKKIAIVSQDTFIFNTSVRNNIAYGLDFVKEEDIKRAAKLANAWEFIQDLPLGLDTPLGDRGTRLSGGQRQRIAIARAILKDPDILILDEATSALDSVTEKLIQKSLETLIKGKTVISIAHRLSTIAKADNVVVMEKGRIIEQGNYQELLLKKGALWKYHQMQYGMQKAVS